MRFNLGNIIMSLVFFFAAAFGLAAAVVVIFGIGIGLGWIIVSICKLLFGWF